MENIGKSFALILILTVAISGLSLMMIKPAFAQTPTPSVPEFNIATTNSSYSVPTTYSTEPYTGQNVTNAGYNVDDLNVNYNNPKSASCFYKHRFCV